MTQFLISPNDDIMRIFGGDKVFSVFNSPMFASIPDNEPLAQSGMLTKKVESVQKQVEGHHFDARKHVLEYDDVINKHREVIYSKRNKILDAGDIHEDIKVMIQDQIISFVNGEIAKYQENELNRSKLTKKVNDFLGITLINDTIENDDINALDEDQIAEYISKIALEEFEKLQENTTAEQFHELERRVMLQSIDELWMRHIDGMSKLREDVAFEGYAQKNPLVVYKEKAYDKFRNLINELEYKVVKAIFSVKNIAQVEEVKMSEEELKNNSAELEKMLENLSEEKKAQVKKAANSGNPLFAQPAGNQNTQNSQPKKKIRV